MASHNLSKSMVCREVNRTRSRCGGKRHTKPPGIFVRNRGRCRSLTWLELVIYNLILYLQSHTWPALDQELVILTQRNRINASLVVRCVQSADLTHHVKFGEDRGDDRLEIDDHIHEILERFRTSVI